MLKTVLMFLEPYCKEYLRRMRVAVVCGLTLSLSSRQGPFGGIDEKLLRAFHLKGFLGRNGG